MRFHLIFLLNIFSVSGFKISVNLDSGPGVLSQENGFDLKIVKKSDQLYSSGSSIGKGDSDKCNFPIKSGSNKIQDFPENFDVRKAWPFCISTFTQDDVSTDFSELLVAIDQISDLICTTNGDKIDVQLTVNQMAKPIIDYKQDYDISIDCRAYQFWSENGLYSLDYQKTDICLPFSNQCKPSFITKDRYFQVNITTPLSISDKMKDLMSYGPAIAFIEIYQDFIGYQSGIYEKQSDERLGVYPFKIIGWGVEGGVDYWLGMKVWGRNWGDKGAFKIRRSEQNNGILKNWFSITLNAQPVRNHELSAEQSFYLAHKTDGNRYENINGCLVVQN